MFKCASKNPAAARSDEPCNPVAPSRGAIRGCIDGCSVLDCRPSGAPGVVLRVVLKLVDGGRGSLVSIDDVWKTRVKVLSSLSQVPHAPNSQSRTQFEVNGTSIRR